MTILAFDIGKVELVGVRADKNGKVKEQFVVPNDPEQITTFLRTTIQKFPHLLIGSEATGDYHMHLARAAFDLSVPFRLLNPILTKQYTRATVRKKKTDKTDAEIIAQLLARGEGTHFTQELATDAKVLSRAATKVTQVQYGLTLMQKRLRNLLPPDYEAFTYTSNLISTSAQAIQGLQKLADRSTDPSLKKLLLSIPGVGKLTAVTYITEIGAIERFTNAKALIAFAGLDPKVRQSGLLLNKNTRLTKRGSPHLRRAAYLSAQVASRFDPELSVYYQKKMNEHHKHRKAIIAVSKKLLYRIYAVWKRGTPYIPKPMPI